MLDLPCTNQDVQVIKDVLATILSNISVNNSKINDERKEQSSHTIDDDDDEDDDIDVHINPIDMNAATVSSVGGVGLSSAIHSSPYSLSHVHHSHQSMQPQQRTIPSLQRHQYSQLDIDSAGLINGVNTFDYDLNQIRDEDKPWRKPGADITDYFNYGFNEESWTLYCLKQRRLRAENVQINVAFQKTPVLNASGLIAQVFKSGKMPIVSAAAPTLNIRKQPPTNIDVIGATDETSRRQGSSSVANQNVPNMSTPPPGFVGPPSVNSSVSLASSISGPFNHMTSQVRHSGVHQRNQQQGHHLQQNVTNNAGSSFLPAPTAIQLQQQFAAALAAVRFPQPRSGGQNTSIHCRPSSSIPQRMQNIYHKVPATDLQSHQDTIWENPNAPITRESERSAAGGMSDNRNANYPLERGKKTSPGGRGRSRHHSKDRRSISPRNSRHDHRYHRYRGGRSPAADRRHGSPSSSYRSRHHRRSSRYHSPSSSHGIRRRESSDGSDVTRRHTSKRRYRDSRSPSTNRVSSSKHKRRSRSMKSRSPSRRRLTSRQKETRSRSRSKRKDDSDKDKC
ncbi:hypothetical protein GJ496_010029 [Pomphorhynchus laevis]|nr:hypothetical protein GJ496_010029 [Pomphorhynchus laevis]